MVTGALWNKKEQLVLGENRQASEKPQANFQLALKNTNRGMVVCWTGKNGGESVKT